MSNSTSLTIIQNEEALADDVNRVGREFVRLSLERARRGGPRAYAVRSLAERLLAEIEFQEQHERRLAAEVLRTDERAADER
jgi:hypothetical protein